MRRLAAVVPALHANLQERATAVVEADRLRAEASAAYQRNKTSIDQVLPFIRCQALETQLLIETLAAYNRSIGEYALLVLPPSIAADELVQTLVVVKQP